MRTNVRSLIEEILDEGFFTQDVDARRIKQIIAYICGHNCDYVLVAPNGRAHWATQGAYFEEPHICVAPADDRLSAARNLLEAVREFDREID